MRSLFHSLLILLFAANLFSQTPEPTPTPTPADDEDIVKISTTLIQVDATVTDKRGRIVSDLKAEDFEVFENGEKQEITNFSFISVVKDLNQKTKKKTDRGRTVPVPYPAAVMTGQIRRTIALVVDDLTLSSGSMAAVRKGLRKFVNEKMLPGDFVAIIKTGGGSGALQQFTSDKDKLNSVIDQLRWNPGGLGGVGTFEPIGGLIEHNIPGREDVISKMFLSVKNIIRSMKSVPGRKSLMLLSDGFSLTVSPSLELETDLRNEDDSTTTRELSIAKELVKLANRSSVVIYTMDARGVQYTGITAADNTLAIPNRRGRPAALNPRFRSTIRNRQAILDRNRAGLKFVAEETGGFSIQNNNDISNGIEKVVQDQSYYLIAYEPGEESFDPETRRFNKLQIKVKRKGLKVRYRSGFFGISESDENKTALNNGESEIVAAIKLPYARNDIDLNLNALFAIDSLAKISVRSFLHIDANDLKFVDEPGEKKVANIEILSVSFDASGAIEDQFSKSHKIIVSPAKYQEIKRDGLIYFFVFPIEKGGGREMRVALRDQVSGKTGTASRFIKIPMPNEKRLALSGIVVENLTLAEWKARQSENTQPANESTPLLDNALRRFQSGSVLTYGFEAYHVKTDKEDKSQLFSRTKLFRNGEVIYEGKDAPVALENKSAEISSALGALNLPAEFTPGSYVLQIIVTDKLAKRKYRTATQFVQFEIVKQKSRLIKSGGSKVEF
ncbi:MAG: VWA domain-containing protein [Pyrinomonadaceae bacterium]|nr:VWA domain-containing protein [Pyrinomonadaceae bacterium]